MVIKRKMPASGTFHDLGPFAIPGLQGTRRVRVYTPRGYDPSRPRPALYMFDGQNVFDDAPSFAGGWKAHRAVDRLSPRTNYPPVVVGIEHGGSERIDELGPWSMRGRGGRTDRLLDWMGSDLIPMLPQRFGIISGPVGTVIAGSSLGGLAALYAHFRRPDLFGGVIAISPSFWFAQRAIFPFVAETPNPWTSRIYLDCGAKEAGGRMLGVVEDMAKHLAERGYGTDKLMWRPDARGGHSERHWRRRLPKALRFMFRR